MKLTFQLMQTVALECPFCERWYDAEQEREEAVMAALIGWDLYGKCPVCQRPATIDPKDLRRWGMWKRKVGKWRTLAKVKGGGA